FAVYRCGFYPLTAMSEDNGMESRIDKILKIIEKCKYGIHDISRTELTTGNNFPRFNMPFELGLFYGARRFGDDRQKKKNALIMEKVKYSYQQFLSDISGVDIKAHNNNPDTVIRHVRNWLHTSSRRKSLPTPTVIISEYTQFLNRLSLSVT